MCVLIFGIVYALSMNLIITDPCTCTEDRTKSTELCPSACCQSDGCVLFVCTGVREWRQHNDYYKDDSGTIVCGCEGTCPGTSHALSCHFCAANCRQEEASFLLVVAILPACALWCVRSVTVASHFQGQPFELALSIG